jgi:hypothetical protein
MLNFYSQKQNGINQPFCISEQFSAGQKCKNLFLLVNNNLVFDL